jgi:hypothetical protein
MSRDAAPSPAAAVADEQAEVEGVLQAADVDVTKHQRARSVL